MVQISNQLNNINRYIHPKKDRHKFNSFHKDSKLFGFEFDYQRINNSYYVIAKEHLHKELVKDESPDFHEPFYHNSAIDFAKSLDRRPFVSEKERTIERRFEFEEAFGKSQHLITDNRMKSIVPFKTVTARD